MHQHGIVIKAQPFFNEKAWSRLYKPGYFISKSLDVGKGFIKRLWAVIFLVHKYDFVLVHREASPIGPPIFEWIVTKIWRKKLVFDFDDAIWIPAISEQNKIANSIKCFWKTKWICKWAYKVAAGNNYLANYASQFNANVTILPTSVDTQNRYRTLVNQSIFKPAIGWTGSHSTMKYLDLVIPFLRQLEKEKEFDFYVISNKEPKFELQSLKFIKWTEETEIEDLSKINIGLMPLEADRWSEGKCGFKIIQYLALGIPAVASPVGVNAKIIENNQNGYLCQNENEWYQSISLLLDDRYLRKEMGRKGREKIIREYSIHVNADLFLELFK
ncbi:glycosyltransferase [Flavisolibacter ginsengisoli]|jgi:glycosyltransferase involved in cell wall biosynthesis|nr:glycosyltransferase [Flavisolibacter ginsengisoli]